MDELDLTNDEAMPKWNYTACIKVGSYSFAAAKMAPWLSNRQAVNSS